jgi:hypothetical protein
MSGFGITRRTVRVLTILGLAAAAALGPASAAHAAGPTLPAGTYLACPDVTTLAYATTYSCENLSSAVSDAEAWNANTRENATVDLLPGQYCPVQLPYDPYALTIQGVGFAGVKNPSDVEAYTGFEADLSEFSWAVLCTQITGDGYFLENLPNPEEPNEIWGQISLANFAVNGTAGGPTSGINVTNAPLSGRDLQVENLSDVGLVFTDDFDFYNGEINDSAFVNNGIGAEIGAGESHGVSIDESTFAGNTEYGVEGGGFFNLGGDTIAHNANGLGGSIDQLATSIVGDNTTTNCAGSISDDFGLNVLGGGCNLQTGADADIPLTSTIGALSTGDEITPSIQPVSEAALGASLCGNLDGTDQEERIVDNSSCDVGSVQPAATAGDPTPSGDIDFGAVPTNDPSSQTEQLTAGGGLVGVRGVETAVTSGSGGFTVTTDNCSYSPLIVLAFGQGACSVTVQATSAVGSGATAGTLTFHTTDGDITVNLSSTGAPAVQAAGAPTQLTPTAGNRRVTLNWQAPSDDGGVPLQYYEIDDSTNGGTSWQVADTDYDTSDTSLSDTIYNLTNGTAYQFRIRAENGVVDGAWSSTVSATPRGAQHSSALSAPHSATIRYGRITTLVAKLTDTTAHAAIGHTTVTLLSGSGTSGSFHSLKKLTTSASGVATAAVHPTLTSQYKFSFVATSAHGAATSSIATVRVAQAVSAALTTAKLAPHSTVSIYGTVLPAASGEKVVLQIKVNGKWRTVGRAKTKHQKLPNGKNRVGFVIKYTPSAKGKQTLRVLRAADATNSSGASKTLTLTVT